MRSTPRSQRMPVEKVARIGLMTDLSLSQTRGDVKSAEVYRQALSILDGMIY